MTLCHVAGDDMISCNGVILTCNDTMSSNGMIVTCDVRIYLKLYDADLTCYDTISCNGTIVVF